MKVKIAHISKKSLCTHLEPMTFFDASSGDVVDDGDDVSDVACSFSSCFGIVASYTIAGCMAASFPWLDILDVVR